MMSYIAEVALDAIELQGVCRFPTFGLRLSHTADFTLSGESLPDTLSRFASRR